MTRETKLGMVVTASFLSLVGVVVSSKLSAEQETPPAEVRAQAEQAPVQKPETESPPAATPPAADKGTPAPTTPSEKPPEQTTPQGRMGEESSENDKKPMTITTPPEIINTPTNDPNPEVKEAVQNKDETKPKPEVSEAPSLTTGEDGKPGKEITPPEIPVAPPGLPTEPMENTAKPAPTPMQGEKSEEAPAGLPMPVETVPPVKEALPAEKKEGGPGLATPVPPVAPPELSGPMNEKPEIKKEESATPKTEEKVESGPPVATTPESAAPTGLPTPEPVKTTPIAPPPPPADLDLKPAPTPTVPTGVPPVKVEPSIPVAEPPLTKPKKEETPAVVIPASDKIAPVPASGPEAPPVVARANDNRPAAAIRPEVVRFTEEEYVAKPGDTYAKICEAKLLSAKYAEALKLYNQNDALQGPPTLEKDGSIKPGASVSIPEPRILEKRYADKIPGLKSPLGGSEEASVEVNKNLTPTPIAGTPTQGVKFLVPFNGMTMREMAARFLNNGDRVTDIARLNPGLPANMNLAAGTQVVLPPDAKLPAELSPR